MSESHISNHIQSVAPINVNSNEAILKNNIWFVKEYSFTVSLTGILGFEYTISLDNSDVSNSGVFASSAISVPFTFLSAGAYKYTLQYSFRSKIIDTYPVVFVIDTQQTPSPPTVSIYKIYHNGTITLHIHGAPASRRRLDSKDGKLVHEQTGIVFTEQGHTGDVAEGIFQPQSA